MDKKFIFVLMLLCLFGIKINAQIDNLKIGSTQRAYPLTNGAVFDYSAPGLISMHISVWGYVRFPGRFIVPTGITLTDIASYAGGPTADALMEDIRVIRVMADSSQEVFTFNYNDIMHEPKINGKIKDMVLLPGDIVVFTGEPRFYFRDYFNMTLTVVSTLISLSILILNIVRK